ncbi:MAG: ABC transporter permease [Tepidimonas ignava]|uniref:ABC transporter permease n=1 Tax=Tepidimonas ignava TaxID=114249 RepID=UPI00391CD515
MGTLGESVRLAFGLLLSGDAVLWHTVARSLLVSGLACAFACVVGLPLSAWLALARFAGRGAVVTVLNALLAVPSVLVGLLVYLLLSRSGPLGHLGWLFSLHAMVLAQALLVLPLVAALTRQLIEDAHARGGEQLQSLGAGRALRALLLAWDERHALVTVLITVFGRAISEVGTVMIVGGNIEGYTRVMTTAIALETSKGDLPLALALGLVLLLVVWALHALVAVLRRLGQRGTAAVETAA